MKISCPSCGAKLKFAKAIKAGKSIRCPGCEFAFAMPDLSQGSTAEKKAVASRGPSSPTTKETGRRASNPVRSQRRKPTQGAEPQPVPLSRTTDDLESFDQYHDGEWGDNEQSGSDETAEDEQSFDEYGDGYGEELFNSPPQRRKSSANSKKSKRAASAKKKKDESQSKVPLIIGASVVALIGIISVVTWLWPSGPSPVSLAWLPPKSEIVVRFDMPKLISGSGESLLQNPLFKNQIDQFVSAAGYSINDVESLTIGIAGVSTANRTDQDGNFEDAPMVAVLRSLTELNAERILKGVPESQLLKTTGGHPLIVTSSEPETGIVFVNSTTALLGQRRWTEKASSEWESGPEKLKFGLAPGNMAITGVFYPSDPNSAFRGASNDVPRGVVSPQFEQISRKFLQTTRAFGVGIDLTDDVTVAVNVEALSEQEAGDFSETFKAGITDARKALDAYQSQAPPLVLEQLKSANALLESCVCYQEQAVTKFIATANGAGKQIASTTAMRLPAVMQARSAARRAQSKNNIKQILLAWHNYHDVFKVFPPGFPLKNPSHFDANGRPHLSWRVHILPFIEHAPLYNEFHLNEPWNSPHNLALLPRMPKGYQSPLTETKTGKTVYQAVTGPGAIFENQTASRIRDILDGTTNTIAVVETVGEGAVEWTKPSDYEYSATNPFTGLRNEALNGFLAGMCDGHIEFVSNSTDPAKLVSMFTKNERHSQRATAGNQQRSSFGGASRPPLPPRNETTTQQNQFWVALSKFRVGQVISTVPTLKISIEIVSGSPDKSAQYAILVKRLGPAYEHEWDFFEPGGALNSSNALSFTIPASSVGISSAQLAKKNVDGEWIPVSGEIKINGGPSVRTPPRK